MATYEELIRQHIGMPLQQGAQQLGQLTDQAAQAAQQKLAALQAVSAKQAPPQQMPQAIAQAPDQSEVLPNDPSMSAADAQSRQQAMLNAPLTMDQVAAKLRAQADEDAAQQAHQNSIEDQDMSGYTDVPSQVQKQARFKQLKQKVAPQDDEE